LTTRDAIYSYDDKYENFFEAFRNVDWDKIRGKKVLLLGLGLGSVILILEKYFYKVLDYTAIEIDEEICRLCNKYTLSNLKSYVEVRTMEAMKFLEYDQESYDIIIMDIFQSAVIPQKFQTIEYLEMLNGKLNGGGILLYNRMNMTEGDKTDNAIFRDNMKQVFPAMKELKVKSNIVLINDKGLLLQ